MSTINVNSIFQEKCKFLYVVVFVVFFNYQFIHLLSIILAP